MKQKILVNPTEPNPTHHVQLSGPDGKSIGLILADARGNVDSSGLSSQPYPRTAIKTFTGGTDLDSEEPPYNPITQTDFSGGMGKQIFDEDKTRFEESHWVDPSYPGKLMLSPIPELQIVQLYGNHGHGATLGSSDLYFDPTKRYIACSFTPIFTAALKYSNIWGRVFGTLDEAGTGIYMHLYSNSAGIPGTLLDSSTELTNASMNALKNHQHDTVFPLNFTMNTGYTVTAGTTYWIVIDMGTNTDQENCVKVAVCNDGTLTGKNSSDLVGWTSGDFGPYFHSKIAQGAHKIDFHVYRGATYGVVRFTNFTTNSAIIMNGDRGCCDSNAGQTTKIIDATKAWATNMWAGATVVVTRGTQPNQSAFVEYRKIVSNTATELTLDQNFWDTTVTTDEYIITDTPIWTTVVADVGFPAYDSLVFDGQIMLITENVTSLNGFIAYQKASSGIYTQGMLVTNASYLSYWSNWAQVIEAPASSDIEDRTGEMLIGGASIGRTGLLMHTVTARAIYGYYTAFVYGAAGVSAIRGSANVRKALNIQTLRSPTEQSIANVTPALNYGQWKFAIAAGFTTGNIGSGSFPSFDITTCGAGSFIFNFYSTVALAGGDFQVGWSDTAAMGGTPQWHNVPACNANEWTQATIGITPSIAPAPDESKIISVGFRRQVNKGAHTFYAYSFNWTDDHPEYVGSDVRPRINSATTYTGSLDGSQRKSAWIFTDDGEIMEYQASSNKFVPLFHPALRKLGGVNFGRTSAQHGLYLYFNVNRKLSRYYNNQIDDVGPDREDGFAISHRKAFPFEIVSHPGILFVNYQHEDWGNTTSLAIANQHPSFIMAKRDSGGWWEFAHQGLTPAANPIRSLGILKQILKPDKLLWNEAGGQSLYGQPISSKALQEDIGTYNYSPTGTITTSKYYANRRDIIKFWKSVKITADNLGDGISTADKVDVEVEYRTDEHPEWTLIPKPFDVSPFETQDFSALNDVTGRWIQLRLRLNTSNKNVTPVIWGIVIESMIRVPTKDAYSLTFRLANQDVDLRGQPEVMNAQQKYSVLKEWIASATPVTMNTLDDLTHGITVYPEPTPIRRTQRKFDDGGPVKTVWLCQMTLLEI